VKAISKSQELVGSRKTGKGVYYLTDPGSGTSYLTVLSGPNVLISGTGFKTPAPRHGPLAPGNSRQRRKFRLAQQLQAKIQLQQAQLQNQHYPPRLAALPNQHKHESWRAEEDPFPAPFPNHPGTGPQSIENSPFREDIRPTSKKKKRSKSAGNKQEKVVNFPDSPKMNFPDSPKMDSSVASTITDREPDPNAPFEDSWLREMGAVNADNGKRRDILHVFDREMNSCMIALRSLDEESLKSSAIASLEQQSSVLPQEPLQPLKEEVVTTLGRGIFDSQASFPTLYKDKLGLSTMKTHTRRKLRKQLEDEARKPSEFLENFSGDVKASSRSTNKKGKSSGKKTPKSHQSRKKRREFLTKKYAEKYQKIADRRKDYELYFFLSNRYGPLTEDDFFLTEKPGRLFVMLIRASIRIIARFWRHVACPLARRQNSGALILQTFMRMVAKRIKYLKIQGMRFRNRRLRILRKCWFAWKKDMQIMHRVNLMLGQVEDRLLEQSFTEWRRWHRLLASKREELVLANIRNTLLSTQRRVFMGWVQYMYCMRKVKDMYRKNVLFPCFYKWQAFVRSQNNMKGIVNLQAIIRGNQCRQRFLHVLKLKSALTGLVKIRMAIHLLRRKRAKDAQDYIEQRSEHTTKVLVRNELERLKQAQEACRKGEHVAYDSFDDWLRTSEGKELVRYETKLEMEKQKTHVMDDMLKYTCKQHARQKLLQQHLATARANILHDFDLHKPPQFKCADPACSATFILKDHYEMHCKTSPSHLSIKSFVDLHLTLLDETHGVPLLREYLDLTAGVGMSTLCLELWLAVARWKEMTTGDAQFRKKALKIFYSFISKGAITRGPISDHEEHLIAEPFLQYQHMEKYLNTGTKFKPVLAYRAPKGMPLSVALFDNAQWSAFKHLLENVWDSFLHSQQGKKYLAHRQAQEVERIESGTRQFLSERKAELMHEAKTLKKDIKKRKTMLKEELYFESLRARNGSLCSSKDVGDGFSHDSNERVP